MEPYLKRPSDIYAIFFIYIYKEEHYHDGGLVVFSSALVPNGIKVTSL